MEEGGGGKREPASKGEIFTDQMLHSGGRGMGKGVLEGREGREETVEMGAKGMEERGRKGEEESLKEAAVDENT